MFPQGFSAVTLASDSLRRPRHVGVGNYYTYFLYILYSSKAHVLWLQKRYIDYSTVRDTRIFQCLPRKIEWGNSQQSRARAEIHPPIQRHVEHGYGKSSWQ